jgi:predicted Ser/Thr protein kinase
MESKLLKLLDEVHDEQSFLKFVQALIADRADEVEKEKIKPSSPYGAGVNGWENGTIESYLQAAAAWASDSDFGKKKSGDKLNKNCWSQFANFLYAGKIYE